MAKRVIHGLMPKFTEKVIDLIEDRCFKFEKQSKGLDQRLLQATREHEHDFIIAMLKRSVSFVMLDVFLEKLEVENADLLYVQYPAMVEVCESIQEDSVDHDELDDIPRILKRRIDDGGVDEEVAPDPSPVGRCTLARSHSASTDRSTSFRKPATSSHCV
ncbi:RYR1 [Symbiodinium sp. CCMP2592]|nr:RYR1 [Symbiodinium sp. CCMP2592]CAE7530405.1 RYR1 [Symbiodinium sp. CCMP2592]